MKKKLLILFTILTLLLCGCQSEPDPEAIDFSTAPTIPIEEVADFPLLDLEGNGRNTNLQGDHMETEIGMFLMKQVGDTFGRILHFFDYTTDTVYRNA